MDTDVLSIKQLNCYIKSVFEGDNNLRDLFVIGEISNFKNHFSSGHLYFSLMDSCASVRCVMFSDYSNNLRFIPSDGDEVLLRCDVSLFEKTGTYQLYVKDMQKLGEGKLNLELNLLTEKLEKEGLFKSENKKPLPAYPSKIGIITSKTGAVIEDIKTVLKSRYPLAQLLLYHSLVQGITSAKEIINGLDYFDKNKEVDVIIIARGGGANEDLSAFNEEDVVRKVYSLSIPVVSAVGHETNFTLCDYVADVRAATPSVAAELVSPNSNEILQRIEILDKNISKAILEKIELKRKYIDNIMANASFVSPENKLQQNKYALSIANNKLDNAINLKLKIAKNNYDIVSAKLEFMNPFVILERGYSIVLDSKDKAINSIKQVNTSDKVKIKTANGIINCKVISTQEE